jgi:HEAT repeat protein
MGIFLPGCHIQLDSGSMHMNRAPSSSLVSFVFSFSEHTGATMTEPSKRSTGRGKDKQASSPEQEQVSGEELKVRGQMQAELDVLQVRKVVAGNPNTPRQVLARLAEDSSAYIRKSVAVNPKTPPDVLKRLASDQNSEVRLAVAENPHIPAEILAMLVEDADVDVRFGVAENPHIHEDVLFQLTTDENPFVRHRAMKTLEMLAPDVQSRLKIMLQQAFLFSHNNGTQPEQKSKEA